MAARLLLRRGTAGLLKTMLLEAQVFRGLTSTASLRDLMKNETEMPSSSTKQSPSQNVVQAEERGQPLTSHPAAALAANLPPPGSPPTGGDKGQVAPSTRRGGSLQLTDEGLLRPLSRKTLVDFPQKVPSRFGEQGSGSDSSSSSSSSDSESDEEGLGTEPPPQMASKGKKGLPTPEASRSSKHRAPQTPGLAEEGTKAQRPQIDVTHPEQPPQPRKKGTLSTQATSRARTPTPEAEKEGWKQNLKAEPAQKGFRLHEEASQKPREVKGASSDHTQGRFPAGLSPESTPLTTEASRLKGQLPATVAGAQGRHLESKEMAPPPARGESAGKLETGLSGAKKTRHAQVPTGSTEAAPVQEGVIREETEAPMLKGGPRETPTEDAAQGAASMPHEPFFSDTYRNLQHHDYNPYTFLDINLDLAKFRLPQPSSGRESPRH